MGTTNFNRATCGHDSGEIAYIVRYYPSCNATGLIAVVQGIAIASCKSNLGYIFTSDEWVFHQDTLLNTPWKANIFVYILLLFAETSCRSSRRPSQPAHSFSSLMRCWYIRLFCLPLCMTGICIINGTICVCFQCVCFGILIGCGMQKIVALSNLVAYYFIGLPVGIALMFAAKLKILGNDFIWFNRCLFVLDLCETDLFPPFILEKNVLNIDSRTETN